MFVCVGAAHQRPAETVSRVQKSVLGLTKDQAAIYALTDPRSGRIRYIGRSVNPHTRKWQHGYSPSRRMRAWLAALAPHRPTLMILEVCRREDAWAREQVWIRRYQHQRLLNAAYLKRRKPVPYAAKHQTSFRYD